MLVKTTAQALAGEIYDAAMRINDNYDVWKKLCPDMDSKRREAEWINLMWPAFSMTLGPHSRGFWGGLWTKA